MKSTFLTPDPWDVVFSLKTFVAGVLALLIAFSFDLPNPFWALTTVYVVAHPLSGASTSKAVYRLIGTAIGGSATIVFVPNLIGSPELLTLVISLWMGGCLFLSLLDRTPRSYAYMLAGYTTALTSFPIVANPETAFTYSTSRVIEIAVAIICAAVVNRIVFPRHAGPVLAGRVDAWLRDGAALATGVMSGEKDTTALVKISRKLAADAVDIRGFTTHISYDTSGHREMTDKSRELQRLMVALLPIVSGLSDVIAALDRENPKMRPPEMDVLIADISTWVSSGQPLSEETRSRFLATMATVEGTDQSPSWNRLLAGNLVARLRDLVQIWSDCIDLKSDIATGSIHPRRWQRFGFGTDTRPMHQDYGMALFSAFSAALATSLGAVFWIVTGWPQGGGAAMMAGILTCFFSTMDNAAPILKKFLIFTLVSMVGTFVFQFAVMPMLDGFVPLVLALGFLFLPLGLLIAKPQTFLLGMVLSTNIPSMISLQARPSFDLALFINSNMSTPIGIVLAISVATLVRSVGAEWSAHRLLRAGWTDIIAAAQQPKGTDFSHLLHRMLDRLGLIAPRLAAIPAHSPVSGSDILKDLRAGINVIELQRHKQLLLRDNRKAIDGVLDRIAVHYQAKRAGQATDPPDDDLLAALDHALQSLEDGVVSSAVKGARRACVGLRYNLFPTATAFLPERPIALQEAAE